MAGVLISPDGNIRSISRPAEALFGLGATRSRDGRSSRCSRSSQRAARDYLNGLSDNGVASVLNDGREVIGREAEGGSSAVHDHRQDAQRQRLRAVMRDITPRSAPRRN